MADYAAERSGVASDEVEYGVRPLMSPFPWEIAATPGWTMAIHLESLNGPSGDVFPVLPRRLLGMTPGPDSSLSPRLRSTGTSFLGDTSGDQRVHQVESLTSQGLVMSRVFKPA